MMRSVMLFHMNKYRKKSDDKERYEPQRTSDEERSGGEQKKRLASCIVSPALRTTLMEENVTIRNISMARSLTYSPHATENALENEQIIGDLNGMELLESNDEEAMDYDVQEDDLLGEELMELEGHEKPADVAKYAEDTDLDKRAKKARGGNIVDASLGAQNRKPELFRRGSPRLRSVLSSKHNDTEKSRRRGDNSKKVRGTTTKDDGLMGSRNPSHHN